MQTKFMKKIFSTISSMGLAFVVLLSAGCAGMKAADKGELATITPLPTISETPSPPTEMPPIVVTPSDDEIQSAISHNEFAYVLSEDIVEEEYSGTIWLSLSDTKEFLSLDFDNHEYVSLSAKIDCYESFQPNTSTVLCEDGDDLLLLDLSSNEQILIDLPSDKMPGWISYSNLLGLLYFGEDDGHLQEMTMNALFVHNGNMLFADKFIDYSAWDGSILSIMPGNGTLAFSNTDIAYASAIYNRRFTIHSYTADGFEEITVSLPQNINATAGLRWANQSNQLLVGGMESDAYDVGVRPVTHLFLYDIDSDNLLPILAFPDQIFEEFWDEHVWLPTFNQELIFFWNLAIWSPDDENVVLYHPGFGDSVAEICILEIDTGELSCFPIDTGINGKHYHGVRSSAWSPDGEKLVLTVYDTSFNSDVLIFNIETGVFDLLISDIYVSSITWVK